MKLNEQIHRIKEIMGFNEEEIQIEKDPNLMHFFHGGDLEDMNNDYQQKSNRQKFGAGLYLTTRYEVVQNYAKGNRKLYLISVQKGNDLNDKILSLESVMQFLNSTFSKPKVKKIVEWLNFRPLENNEVPAYLINNILVNHNLLTPKNSNLWKSYLMQNNIDYELVDNAFGWGELMMVLYNTDLIKNVRRIMPKDRLSTYNLNTVNENVSQITSGEAVWNHIVSITPDEEDIPWGFKKIIKQNSFIPIDDFDLRSLLTTDPDFKQFYEHNKDNEYFRYDPSEVNSNELDQEIVVVNGELLDGYSRAATKLANGETKTNAFVASKGTIKIDEKVTKNEIICDKCGWKWKKKDGGKDLYICHKCNHNNKPK